MYCDIHETHGECPCVREPHVPSDTRDDIDAETVLADLLAYADAGTPVHPGALIWDDARRVLGRTP